MIRFNEIRELVLTKTFLKYGVFFCVGVIPLSLFIRQVIRDYVKRSKKERVEYMIKRGDRYIDESPDQYYCFLSIIESNNKLLGILSTQSNILKLIDMIEKNNRYEKVVNGPGTVLNGNIDTHLYNDFKNNVLNTGTSRLYSILGLLIKEVKELDSVLLEKIKRSIDKLTYPSKFMMLNVIGSILYHRKDSHSFMMTQGKGLIDMIDQQINQEIDDEYLEMRIGMNRLANNVIGFKGQPIDISIKNDDDQHTIDILERYRTSSWQSYIPLGIKRNQFYISLALAYLFVCWSTGFVPKTSIFTVLAPTLYFNHDWFIRSINYHIPRFYAIVSISVAFHLLYLYVCRTSIISSSLHIYSALVLSLMGHHTIKEKRLQLVQKSRPYKEYIRSVILHLNPFQSTNNINE